MRPGSRSRRAAGALTVLILGLAGPAAAEPRRPTDDAEVLITLPASAAGPAAVRLAARPDDLEAALAVAAVALRDARSEADTRRYGQAEAALKPWWIDPAPPASVRVLRAMVRQGLHEFAAAEADLDAVLAAAPGHGQARLTRAFLLQATGRPAAALEDCRRLPASLGLVPAAACRARAEALAGRATEGLALLDRILAASPEADPALLAWGQSVAAEITWMTGDEAGAERRFALAGRDAPTLAARADLLLATGRPAAAVALLEGAGTSDPVLLRLAIAGAAAGDQRASGWAATLRERFAAARLGGVGTHRREEARFALEVEHDAAGALAIAVSNWAVQREPADALVLLAAARASGRPEAARPVLDHLRETGLADRRLAPIVASLETRP